MAPWSTRRRQVVLAGAKAARIVVTEGPAGAIKRLPRVATWAPQVLGVARLPQTPPALPPVPPPGQELTYNEEYQIWLHHHAPGAQELAAQLTWLEDSLIPRWANSGIRSVVANMPRSAITWRRFHR